MKTRKVLIVANQTAGGEHLKEVVHVRMARGPSEFVLVVPAVPPGSGWTWTQAEANAVAVWRMNEAVDGLRDIGAEVSGFVGVLQPRLSRSGWRGAPWARPAVTVR